MHCGTFMQVCTVHYAACGLVDLFSPFNKVLFTCKMPFKEPANSIVKVFLLSEREMSFFLGIKFQI